VVLLVGGALWGIVHAAAAGGDPEAGRAVFLDKHCSYCHRPATDKGMSPALETVRRPQGELELVGRLWNHVPVMLAAQDREGLDWPPITAAEMSHLMAYLLADPARDPAPDAARGQVTLMRKGCLKCHGFRGEGGRIQPDLAERRTDYESVATWASAMWTHTPGMVAMARSQGIPYPRFTGDEMNNLLAYLRSATKETAAGAAGRPPGR
jgi:mono/diheme cytochrome c family protein